MFSVERKHIISNVPGSKGDLEDIEHIEHFEEKVPEKRSWLKRRNKTAKPIFVPKAGFVPADPRNPPFVKPEELINHIDLDNGTWICVGDRIYDVTTFMRVHPGGRSIIETFAGKQCDWQFERFHGKHQLTTWADRLLVGRTYPPPKNEFVEPGRWIDTGSKS